MEFINGAMAFGIVVVVVVGILLSAMQNSRDAALLSVGKLLIVAMVASTVASAAAEAFSSVDQVTAAISRR